MYRYSRSIYLNNCLFLINYIIFYFLCMTCASPPLTSPTKSTTGSMHCICIPQASAPLPSKVDSRHLLPTKNIRLSVDRMGTELTRVRFRIVGLDEECWTCLYLQFLPYWQYPCIEKNLQADFVLILLFYCRSS